MNNLSADDFKRLSLEIRHFLAKSTILARITGVASLYLEFPDVGTMHDVHRDIVRALMSDPMMMDRHADMQSYPDDHTVLIAPFAGVRIVLSCKQRFETLSGRSVGYRDVVFVPLTNEGNS